MTELYQNISVGGVTYLANPLLSPEQDFTGELNSSGTGPMGACG